VRLYRSGTGISDLPRVPRSALVPATVAAGVPGLETTSDLVPATVAAGVPGLETTSEVEEVHDLGNVPLSAPDPRSQSL
jgi:hypothetical protein